MTSYERRISDWSSDVCSSDLAFAIGLNIDRDHITLVTLDLAGKIRSRHTREIAFALPETVVDHVRGILPGLLEEGGVDRARILGVGVALPDDLGTIGREACRDRVCQYV